MCVYVFCVRTEVWTCKNPIIVVGNIFQRCPHLRFALHLFTCPSSQLGTLVSAELSLEWKTSTWRSLDDQHSAQILKKTWQFGYILFRLCRRACAVSKIEPVFQDIKLAIQIAEALHFFSVVSRLLTISALAWVKAQAGLELSKHGKQKTQLQESLQVVYVANYPSSKPVLPLGTVKQVPLVFSMLIAVFAWIHPDTALVYVLRWLLLSALESRF